MIEQYPQNISTKNNVLIGIITGMWLFLFLFLVKPFKQGRLDNLDVFFIAISMGLSVMICYFVTIYLQNQLFQKFNKWNNTFEAIILTLFILLSLLGSFIVYKSDITKGSYTVFGFILRDYLPTVLILLPFAFVLRRYFFRRGQIKQVEDDTIYIYGENKLDYLKMNEEDLISISSAQNYIEISFLRDKELQNKLMRSSLKKAHKNLPFLIKVHRSHLINPIHLVSFKDKKNLILTKKEIPFSSKYKDHIIIK